jgi:hypothetical protein
MPLKHKVLLLSCFIALAVVSWIVWGGNSSDPTRLTSSTYSTGPKGAKALYLALEELHVNVKRFRRSSAALDSQRGTLVVYDPKAIPIGTREAKKLKAWVSKGNRLVIIAGRGGLFASRACAGKACNVESPTRALQHFGLSLQKMADISRTKLSATLPEIPEKLEVSAATNPRWKKPGKEWTILAEDDSGPILLTRTIGKGQITALCDPTIFSNQYIRDDQNLRLALAVLLGNGRPTEVLFDEYHHGHVMEDSFWSYVGSSVFAWVLFQTVIGLGLFFYSRRGAYAGRFRSLAPPKGRSSMEYIASMANVLESCKAGPAALEAVLTRFVGQISRRFGVPARNLEQGRLPAGSAATGPADEAVKLIRECRKAIRSDDDSDASVNLARQLAAARQKIIHAGRSR